MTSVAEAMTAKTVQVAPTDSVSKARTLMRKHGYRILPVTLNDKLVGVVSRGDVMKVTSNRTNITVEGVMKKNMFTVKPEDDIEKAAQKMVSSGVRQLPVVDGRLVGVVTSLDLLKNLINLKKTPRKKLVREVLTEKVISLRPDDSLASAWSRMEKSGFSGLPVLTEKNVVSGIVTRGDVIRHGSFRISRESGKTKNIQVKKIMSQHPITISATSKTVEAGELMIKNRIIRIPVVDDEKKMVGIVDVEDILNAYVS